MAATNQLRVLDAMRRHRVEESDLAPSSGYGYHDRGREKLEAIYAEVFGGDAALVRPQIVSGTQALALAFFGNLLPGDELLLATGEPYDTLAAVIDAEGRRPGSLGEMGVRVRRVGLGPQGPDLDAIAAATGAGTRVVFSQRSRGYSARPSLAVGQVGEIVRAVKGRNPQAVCLVDNCYGEFVEPEEPCAAGADLVAGSLIKNPGGGLAGTGGYLVGRPGVVERAAARLTAPGLGGQVGPFLGSTKRDFYQGFYLAPLVVGQALQGAVFAAAFFAALGFEVQPAADEPRTDLIQAITLGSREALVDFCRGIQAGSPVEAHLRPEPWAMPGYDHEVIMAAGAFTQGSSIELSADAPLRPPYTVYLQGGLNLPQVVAASLLAAQRLRNSGALDRRGD